MLGKPSGQVIDGVPDPTARAIKDYFGFQGSKPTRGAINLDWYIQELGKFVISNGRCAGQNSGHLLGAPQGRHIPNLDQCDLVKFGIERLIKAIIRGPQGINRARGPIGKLPLLGAVWKNQSHHIPLQVALCTKWSTYELVRPRIFATTSTEVPTPISLDGVGKSPEDAEKSNAAKEPFHGSSLTTSGPGRPA